MLKYKLVYKTQENLLTSSYNQNLKKKWLWETYIFYKIVL